MNNSKGESMEEPEKAQKFWVCVCCLFSFTSVDSYVEHLKDMKGRVERQLAKVGK